MAEALLVIDVQNDYFGKLPTLNPVETAKACAQLIQKFRQEGKTVIHVQHEATPEQYAALGIFEKGSEGMQFHELVKPLAGEKIVVKHEPSSFINTDLKDYLVAKEIKKLVIVGMLGHNCVSATTYAAVGQGYQCIIVEEAVNAMDLPFNGQIIRAQQVKDAYLAGIQFGHCKVFKLNDVLLGQYSYDLF
ncbi:Isochorismatase-like protein [Gongronella butleri]|nr:Isochorismatase-like protein [Gongronella butleri]